MSGIAGKVVFDRHDSVPREVVCAMAAALAHRGPDGSGFHVGPGIALAHRRLNATASRGEVQPACNEDETVWAAADSDLTNAMPLRCELQALGHRFEAGGNAEIVAHGYEQWGDGVVTRLRGPFAFALWDARRRRLLLGRDRVGIRPLHYAVAEGCSLAFASEIKGLLADPDVPREWDPAAIREYVALGYVPAPATIFPRIVKLVPGHVLVAEHGRVRVSRYWDLSFGPPQPTGCSETARTDSGGGAARTGKRARTERALVERLAALMRESAERHARWETSTVTLLAPEAGSAALAGALRDASRAPLVTVTTAFDAPPLGDVQQARAIAKAVGAHHHTHLVTPDVADLLPRLAAQIDEPFADPALVPIYYEAIAARSHAPIALSAAGSDETWAVSARHRAERLEAQVRRYLGPLRFAAGVVAPILPLPMALIGSMRNVARPPADAWARRHGALGAGSDTLFAADFLRQTAGVDPLSTLGTGRPECAALDPLSGALCSEMKTYLPDNVLVRMDRVSAIAGLALRLPMLDHDLVELAAAVPAALKVRSSGTSDLLQQTVAGRMSAALLRDGRRPIEPQAAAWLRGPLAPLASDILLSGRFRHRGIFDPKAVTRTWQAHLTGRRDHHRDLWTLLMLELWFEHFVDRREREVRAA